MIHNFRPRLVAILCAAISMAGPALADSHLSLGEADLTRINADYLPTADQVQDWHERKDSMGGTFSGSPSWHNYHDILETGFRQLGLVDIAIDSFSYTRWYSSDNPEDDQWTLEIDGENIPVAAYWPYSGGTDAQGVSAELVYYDRDNPPDIEGKIVVFDIPPMETVMPARFLSAGYEYATNPESLEGPTFDQFYQIYYVTRFGRLHDVAQKGKAAGSIIVFDMGPGRAAGLYTYPLPDKPTGVPGIFFDRIAGKKVMAAALEGRQATLTLLAKTEEVEPHFFAGYLPGKNYGQENDEIILMLTHTDGPNITQDNGGLGILSVVHYFAQIPQELRPRTLLVLLDPQHFMPGRHPTDWYELYPETSAKIVASIGIEHLGQRGFMEIGDDFIPTGQPETMNIFAQDNDKLIELAIQAVKDNSVPQVLVQSPPRGGQGQWHGLGEVALKRKLPGFGATSSMSAYWATAAHIDKFDKDHFLKQAALLAQLTGGLMTADLDEIALPVKQAKTDASR